MTTKPFARSGSRFLLALVAVVPFACGGGQKAAPAGPTTAPATTPAAEEDHGAMPAELTAFHHLMGPLWHAEEGPQRLQDTGAQSGALGEKAAAVAAAPLPPAAAVDEPGWKADAEALVKATDELEAACAAEGQPDVAARFTAVHEGFHALLVRLEKKP